MELAREELGPDTMIVYSRKADKDKRHLGEYEVVFAVDQGETTAKPADTPPALAADASSEAPESTPSWVRFSVEVAELRRQMERITGAINRVGTSSGPMGAELSDVCAELIEQGIEPDLARELIGAVPPETGSRNGQHERVQSERAVAEEIARRLEIAPPLETRRAGGRCIIAVVGPPGVGKTLTLVKLAATYGLAARRPVQILSIDNLRIGAGDQLRTYASILGLQFRLVETPRALSQAIDENSNKELLLIDTPGYSPKHMEDAAGVGYFLTNRTDIGVHLVLSAAAKSADLTRTVERFRTFRPDGLIFTRLDETSSYGSIVNTAIRSGLPLSYFSSGQGIPEDLEPASKSRLLSLVMTAEASSAVAAA